MEQEIWKDVVGYEGQYMISNLGRVKSLSRKIKKPYGYRTIPERILKYGLSKGYCMVVLSHNTKTRVVKVHKLVAESFLGHISNGYEMVINHIDNNKLNNNVKNLEICTTRHNANCWFSKKESSSSHLGVTYFKDRKKWTAQIYYNGKHYHLGNFINEIDAANEYKKAFISAENLTFSEYIKNKRNET